MGKCSVIQKIFQNILIVLEPTKRCIRRQVLYQNEEEIIEAKSFGWSLTVVIDLSFTMRTASIKNGLKFDK